MRKLIVDKMCVFVKSKSGEMLMPTTRFGKVRRLLESGMACVSCSVPFTIRLNYIPKTNIRQKTSLGIDPGRDNIGIAVVREDGKCLYKAHVQTRNKQIPKLIEKRKIHRHESRRGERFKRKRRAKKNNTIMRSGFLNRHIPGCKETVIVKDIINTEARFINRKVPRGWISPTATQLLRTYESIIKLVNKILPIECVVVEVNGFASASLPATTLNNKSGTNINNQKSIINSLQGGMCLLCGKNHIDQYHHMSNRSYGGSNGVANLVGLCSKCHNAVHKNLKSKEKLNLLHDKRNKRCGAMRIMNIVMPKLIERLTNLFQNRVYFTNGKKTNHIRNMFNISKTHDNDAYCIAIQAFDLDKIIVDYRMPDPYEILQFRRQNRELIHCQTERTYKLDGVVVAKNRRKRTDQFCDSLHDWYIKMKHEHGELLAKQMQSQLIVIKSKRHYNNLSRVLPGAVFEFEHKWYLLAGNSGRYYIAVGCGNKLFSIKKSRIVYRNSGLMYVV